MSTSGKKVVKVRSGYLDAYASKDGITVSSTEFNGTQKISASAYYNEEGEIETKLFNQSIELTHREYLRNNPELEGYINKVVKTTWIAFIAIIFVISIFGNTMLTLHAIVFLVFSLLTKAYDDIPNYIADICLAKKNRPFSRYHSAEHMTAKARQKFDRVPTLNEVQGETRFDVTCTTAGSIYYMLTSLINTLLLTFSSIFMIKLFILNYSAAVSVFIYLLIIALVLLYIFIVSWLLKLVNKLLAKVLEHEWFVKIFQYPLLEKPTEKELNLAIQAYKIQCLIDKKIRHSPEEYETASYSFDPEDKTVVYELVNGKLFKGTLDEYLHFVKSISTVEITQE